MDGVFLVPFAPFLFVLGIIWISKHHKLEEKRLAAREARQASAGDTQNAARIDELEDRVRVLERIVTDGGYDLASKIEALRDQRRVDELLESRETESSN